MIGYRGRMAIHRLGFWCAVPGDTAHLSQNGNLTPHDHDFP